jgi:endonuclease III
MPKKYRLELNLSSLIFGKFIIKDKNIPFRMNELKALKEIGSKSANVIMRKSIFLQKTFSPIYT